MRNTRTPVLVLALTGALMLATAPAARAADTIADWSTTAKVKIELLTKLGVDALGIDVDTDAGQVQLSGTVDKRATKELAQEIAGSVSGVRGVDEELRLESADRNPDKLDVAAREAKAEVADGILESKVRLALIDKLGSDGFRIGTEAADGVVTLEFGPKLDRGRRAEAEKAARSVPGVAKVISLDASS